MGQRILFFLPFYLAFLSCQGVATLESESGNHAVQFVAVGDVMVHARQLFTAKDPNCECYDFHKTFKPIKSFIESADLAIANLETTLPGEASGYSGYPQFGAPDSLVTALKDTGFDILTTSNNHSVDKGAHGIERTIRILDEHGLLHLGTYANRERFEKEKILLVEKNGIRFSFLSYTYGTNGIPVPRDMVVNLIDRDRIASEIALSRKMGADVVIVLYHFGGEYLRLPDDFQKEMTDFAIQKGAQVVLGGHPHVLQPYRLFRGKDETGAEKDRLVVYSLGNFVSNQQRRYTDGGMILQFQMERDADSGEILISQADHVPVWVQAVFSGPEMGHYILPLSDTGIAQIADGTHPTLTNAHLGMLEVFRSDTENHMLPSRNAARSYHTMGIVQKMNNGLSLVR